jgi:hypothetical protein
MPVTAGVTHIDGFASCADERRNPQARERLRVRVRSEFGEMPDLILTLAQAARLFGMRQDICVRVLRELQTEGLLCETSGGRVTPIGCPNHWLQWRLKHD